VFVKGDPLISCLWATFSIAAPPIERFFIRALKPTVDTITGDEKLIADVKAMIAQEVNHSAAHIIFNKHLESIGFDVKAATLQIEDTLRKMTVGFSPVDMMGVVAAGEHGLYSFALAFIRNPAIRESMNPQVERLFHYHLLEEAEHGAVSHDQYRYFAGNNYFHRLKTALRTRHLFSMLTGTVMTLSGQLGIKITWRNRLAFLSYLWIYPGLLRHMAGNLAGYLAPWYKLTFSHEDQEFLKKWNDELYAGQPQ
ncbi:MAG: metal-dependent hydrolase, partial [Pseudomonadota bacterium]|nr:metal-dependent hydrolase [Pseudomonadota bacterium]